MCWPKRRKAHELFNLAYQCANMESHKITGTFSAPDEHGERSFVAGGIPARMDSGRYSCDVELTLTGAAPAKYRLSIEKIGGIAVSGTLVSDSGHTLYADGVARGGYADILIWTKE